jgi:glycerol-3-phosphate acyltransferase PlsY
MRLEMVVASLIGAYLIGAFPVGLVVVKLLRGRDIRNWFSGRTGGTNVMRMAGFWAGFFTAIIDLLKGTAAVLLARTISDGQAWVEVGSGLLAVLGHNYSIFLFEFVDGRLRLRGGAGGATTAGAVLAFWPPALLIIVPSSAVIFYFIGYASIATMSIGVITTIIFLWRALSLQGSWAYVVFGILVEVLLLWALRPNIERLMKGEERLVGWRAKRAQQNDHSQTITDKAALDSSAEILSQR